MDISKLTLWNMLNEYEKNKDEIRLFIAKKQNKSVECYTDNNPDLTPEEKKILGFGIGVFLTVLVFNIVIFFVGLILLIKNAKTMPTWAVVFGGILLFFGPLSIGTIILVLATKNTH